ncbi:MAG: lipoate-protein ligase A, partial [Candidatus Marinamargulisbacteria bacterium]
MGKIELIRDGFGSAAENMAFDEALLDSRALFDRVIRAYIWQRPGVTYSYNKPAPDPIAELDRSSRPTGGGLVFHSPGDIVFSIVVPVDDLVIDGPLKEKMVRLSMASRLALGQVGISVDGKVVAKRAPNITFCNAYPNPFELYVGGEKVVAMTLRRIKTRVLVQGIV